MDEESSACKLHKMHGSCETLHKGLICERIVVLCAQGLSFQIWPSALNLSRFAEEQHAQQLDCWKVGPPISPCQAVCRRV